MLSIERTFKIGDLVIGFEWKSQGSFKPMKCEEYVGEVVSVDGKWVYIDTMFGAVPFDAANVEYADAPF